MSSLASKIILGNDLFTRSKATFLKSCNLNDCLTNQDDSKFTGTKVIGTVGPACQETDILGQMLEEGMVGARVDLNVPVLPFHQKSLHNLQAATKKTKKMCCTIVDTQGRTILVDRPFTMDEMGWPTYSDSIEIGAGQKVSLTTRTDITPTCALFLPLTYDKFHLMCEVGDLVYAGRYLVSGADSASLYLKVVEVLRDSGEVICLAENDAVLQGLVTIFHVERSTTGQDVANLQNDLPLLTDFDKSSIEALGKEFEIDFISLNMARNGDDVKAARAFLNSVGLKSTKIITKLATRLALNSFEAILKHSDGIMINRGTLGLDVLPEKMAFVQKTIIKACNLVGKPVLLSRLVDTMVSAPRPTRAEATDIANAVLDGIDALITGAETLRGKYPVLTISTIASICRSAEKVFDHQYHYDHLMELSQDVYGDDSQEVEAAGGGSDDEGDRGTIPFAGRLRPKNPVLPHVLSNLGPHPHALESGLPPVHAINMTKAPVMGSVVDLQNFPMSGPHPVGSQARFSKIDAIASSAVRCAEKVQASLIVVYTLTGHTAQMVAKYRPTQPIVALVIPRLVSNGIRWTLEGRSNARQSLLTRGVLPVLSSPELAATGSDATLIDTVKQAHLRGFCCAGDHVVVVQRIHGDFCVKVVSVNELGSGIQEMNPSSSHTCLPSLEEGEDDLVKTGAFASTMSMVHMPAKKPKA